MRCWLARIYNPTTLANLQHPATRSGSLFDIEPSYSKLNRGIPHCQKTRDSEVNRHLK